MTEAMPETPNGAHGTVSQCDPEMVKRHLARSDISAEAVQHDYGMSTHAVDAILPAVAKGETA